MFKMQIVCIQWLKFLSRTTFLDLSFLFLVFRLVLLFYPYIDLLRTLPSSRQVIPSDDEQVPRHSDRIPHHIQLAPSNFVPSHSDFPQWNPGQFGEE